MHIKLCGDTGDATTTRKTSCVRSQDSRNHFSVERATPCSWEQSASTNPRNPPFPGDTPSPSAGRKREESSALHNSAREDGLEPCRKRRHLTPTRQSPLEHHQSGIAAGRERQESSALHNSAQEDVIGPCRKRRHLMPTRHSLLRASP